jgi:hypothetical protein
MTTYHKIGTRSFYKIYDNGTVCHVLNQQGWSEIHFGINGFMIADVKDAYNVKQYDISEAEFNEAYKLAYDRISLQRLDI